MGYDMFARHASFKVNNHESSDLTFRDDTTKCLSLR